MASEAPKKKVAIFGSTGSIGTQALEVIRENKDIFEVEVLTAHTNDEMLIAQSIEFSPNAVVIGDVSKYEKVKSEYKNDDSSVVIFNSRRLYSSFEKD